MISFDEAVARVGQAAWLLPPERVALAASLNRVLAESIHADIDMPPFNKSSMDGYACRAADAFHPLRVLEHVPAGRVPRFSLAPGTCTKVMTGAPVPEGADCVLIVEEVEDLDEDKVRFTGNQPRGNIVPQGDDLRAGDRVLEMGTLLRPQHLPVLASVGCTEPLVRRRPDVAVIATGDELVPPAGTPGPGQIRNSNSAQLTALAHEAGAHASDLGIVQDNEADLRRAWEGALADHDVVLSTGGVSMGDYDLVPDILKHHGFEIHFDRVAIQPGKPVLFATRGDKACFALSGNPVSSFLQFMLFVEPFLRALQGAPSAVRQVPLLLGERFTRRNVGRMGWVPVHLDAEGRVRAIEFHGSAHINAFTVADGLIAFPVNVGAMEEGDVVPVRLL
jgi:molybdopterin molybdotransferase